jgi:pyruvate,water dikinase
MEDTSIEWNASLNGDYLWSNVNFGEAVTGVMTPLTWSVIQFTLDDWIFIPGYSTVAQIGGYPYLNISIFATLFKTLGRSQAELLKYMEATLYMQLPEDWVIPTIPLPPRKRFGSLLASLQVQVRQRRGIKMLPAYLEGNETFFNTVRADIEACTDTNHLHDLWAMKIRPHVKQGVWCVLGTANHASEYTMKLRRDLDTLVGPEDAQYLIANISAPGALLPSLGPVVGLSEVARGEWSRQAYLERYGHRGPQEFELSHPRPAEDPSWLEEALSTIAEDAQDITEQRDQQQARFQAAWERLKANHPQKAKRLHARIEESARRGRLREQARSAYIRDRWLIRIFALQAGALTGVGDGIFFLTLEEVLGLLHGQDIPSESVDDRKKRVQAFKSLPPYPSVIRGSFDPFQWAADPRRQRGIYTDHQGTKSQDGNVIQGSPGSAGIAEGVVRRLNDPEEGAELRKGEVLLALQTDVAWTILFPRAAGVITDVGAPLSHAAIVARELGIPAVVGCGNAMDQLKTGDRVRINGGRGTVTILEVLEN